MTEALTASRMALRFLPKVPLSLRKPAAVMVVCRSSHIRTGRPLSRSTSSASLRLFWARAPSVPSMLRGRPTTISSARCSAAAAQMRAATLAIAFSSIWGFKGVARTSPGSQTARPVRLSP